MPAGGPLRVDFARAGIEARSVATHLLDDVPRVVDEDLAVVRRVVRTIEQRGRARHGGVELRRVDRHPVPLAKRTVAVAAEHRPGIDQREVDVEENGFCRHWIWGNGVMGPLSHPPITPSPHYSITRSS